jgi:hypothetical protein
LPVLTSGGTTWAAWPTKPIITAEGHLVRIAGSSKIRYVNMLHWQDRKIAIRFSQAVVLCQEHDPEAFREEQR